MRIPFRRTKNGIAVTIRVQPRSARKGMEVVGDTLKVKLTSPPVDGAANKELTEILSEELGVRKSSIHITKGLSSRNKVVEIRGVDKV
jgi:uncharacterized protein (TIGR00251 family)